MKKFSFLNREIFFRVIGNLKKQGTMYLQRINTFNSTVPTNNKDVVDVYENYEVFESIKEKSTLKTCLKKFREIVKKETRSKGFRFYSGWPPRNRIKITEDEKLGTFGRKMFIFNITRGVNKVEPNLCVCCNNKNILLFNKKEFESLMKNINFIKHELQEYGKKI